MRTIITLALLLVMISCTKVPAGFVGVKVYLLGGSKGVDAEELGVGRYFASWNEEIYIFPTFTQNKVWTQDLTEDSPTDESFTFQTSEGLTVSADFGISYFVEPGKVVQIFQKYRKGIDEITSVFLRNAVRDSVNKVSSTLKVEDIYGEGKAKFIEDINALVKNKLNPTGIIIENIYLIGQFRLPQNVIAALNSKIESIQRSEQRENELREATAEAQKKIAQAKGEADSLLLTAKAQAEANSLLSNSLTPNLIEYKKIEKWDGVLSKVSGSNALIDLRGK
jgi:regulator of protease activity HflC (stomatin/prohibitin superfamily)